MELNKFYNKDNMEGLKELETNSIDCLVTDPPYGYSFMNKGWDKVLPPITTWKECLRVLKPGAFAFVMSAPRQDVLSRMIINLGDAGFKTGFTSIYWAYASGFPKAGNIGKMVDKKLGKERKIIGLTNALKGRASDNNESYGQHIGNKNINKYEDGYPITIPSSIEAKALDGSYSGFQPKPAVEIIIVVMKPLDQPTYVDQALSNGKGITWLDDCRIPYQSNDKPIMDRSNFAVDNNNDYIGNDYGKYKGGTEFEAHSSGRFPANLLVSDDVVNDGTTPKSSANLMKPDEYNFGGFKHKVDEIRGYNDSGPFSRFFDLDSWWQKNLKDLPYEAQKTFPWLIVPKASSGEKNEGCENIEMKNGGSLEGGIDKRTGKTNQPLQHNNHPTVKPLKLMSYLITLGSRPGDIILDPYGGSGTTGIAAYRLKRQFILFESEPEYHEIAEAKLENEIKKSNKTLFDF